MGEIEDGTEATETITLKVVNQAKEEMFFKVKKSTKMSKIFEAYASRIGVATNNLRFLLDGKKIEANSTPKMEEMEENDQIDVVLEQVGGEKMLIC